MSDLSLFSDAQLRALASRIIFTALEPKTRALFLNDNGDIVCPRLLTGNAKLDKSDGVNRGLFLAPAVSAMPFLLLPYKRATTRFCAAHKAANCLASCIGTATGRYGIGELSSVKRAAIKRAALYLADFELFKELFSRELAATVHRAARLTRFDAHIRLDGTTDLKTSKEHCALTDMVARVAVPYDYCKLPASALRGLNSEYRANLAFSLYGDYLRSIARLSEVWNKFRYFALVVDKADKTSALEYLHRANVRAVDGDKRDDFTTHNAQYSDPCILLLAAKGVKNASKRAALDNLSHADALQTIARVANAIEVVA